MSKREKHANLLLTAARHLDPVDLRTDAHPQINLQAAYDTTLKVWKDMASYGTSQERATLRVAMLAVRAVNEAVIEGRKVVTSDNEKLRSASNTFRVVARRIAPSVSEGDKSTATFSPLGMRLKSLRDLAGAKPFVELPAVKRKDVPAPLRKSLATANDDFVSEDIQRIEELQKFKAKLPRSVKPGDPFVTARMPLLVYTKTPLNPKALVRAGVKYFELRNYGPSKDQAVVDKKVGRERGSAYVFENQLVIGMRPDEVADSRKRPKAASNTTVILPNKEKKVPFKTLDDRLRKRGYVANTKDVMHLHTTVTDAKIVSYRGENGVRYIVKFKDGTAVEGTKQKTAVVLNQDVVRVPGAASRALAAVNKKLGPHTNPLSSGDPASGLIRSPGSHLSFMWLAPDHELSAIGSLIVSGAAFPWRQLESAERRDKRLLELKKELKILQDQQEILAKHKKVLDPDKLKRMSELRELIDRSSGDKVALTSEQRSERLSRLKAQLDAEVRTKNADLFAKIEELREDLVDAEDAKEKRDIQKAINSIQKKIDRSREVLAVKYRNMKLPQG